MNTDQDYLMILATTGFGAIILYGFALLRYKKGPGVRITGLLPGATVPVALEAFVPGKEGISLHNGLITLSIAIPIIIAVITTLFRTIVNPIARLIETATEIANVDQENLKAELEKLATGDLNVSLDTQTRPIDIRRKDETGKIADAFNTMILQFSEAGESFNAMAANPRNVIRQAYETNVSTHTDLTRNAVFSLSDIFVKGNNYHPHYEADPFKINGQRG